MWIIAIGGARNSRKKCYIIIPMSDKINLIYSTLQSPTKKTKNLVFNVKELRPVSVFKQDSGEQLTSYHFYQINRFTYA